MTDEEKQELAGHVRDALRDILNPPEVEIKLFTFLERDQGLTIGIYDDDGDYEIPLCRVSVLDQVKEAIADGMFEKDFAEDTVEWLAQIRDELAELAGLIDKQLAAALEQE